MTLVWKEVIRPGTYWYNDQETGQPRRLTVTSDGIQHFHDSGKKMIGAGLSIPIPLEHQQHARPLTRAERAAQNLKDNAGWVKDYTVHNDKLFALCDIDDPSLVKKLPTTIKWSSPWINSFTDGDGTAWEGVISHLALTTRPRITKQDPFPNMAAALSLAANLRADPLTAAFVPKERGIALSRAGLLSGDGASLQAKYPLAFSLWTGGVRLAASDLAPPPPKEKKSAPPDKKEPVVKEKEGLKDDKELPADDDDSLDMPPPVEGMLEQPEEALIDADGDISVYDVLCDLMEAALGIVLPEGTTSDNFLERAYEAFWDKIKMGKEPELPPEPLGTPPPGNKPPPSNPIIQEQAPMYMSLEDIRKAAATIADPDMKKIIEASLSLQANQAKESDALRKRAFLEAERARNTRIDRLKKRRKDQKFATHLDGLLQGAQLSLGDDGAVKDSLSPILDVIEAGMPDLPALLTGSGGDFLEQAHPKEYDGKRLPESRRIEVSAELARAAGLEPVAAK